MEKLGWKQMLAGGLGLGIGLGLVLGYFGGWLTGIAVMCLVIGSTLLLVASQFQ